MVSGFAVTVLLLAFLTTTEVTGVSMDGASLRCNCIGTESKPIGRHIKTLRVIQANSHCPNQEIIATLKGSGKMICLNPNALWVKRILKRFTNKKKP